MWQGQEFPASDFSAWLALNIEARLRECPHWLKTQPIAIGSWGRGELAPQSDLDVIFSGSEDDVRLFLDEAKEKGIELKYRFSKNSEDWSRETNVFELNALFSGKPFSREAATALTEQKNKILNKKKTFRRKLLKEFERERTKRNQRYDSIANYLEPQIKFGPGGLRDIQQALMVAFWFEDFLGSVEHIISSLKQIKGYILTVRQKLHLLGYGDTLVAQSQRELAEWFGYSNQAEFMQEYQKIIFKVSFYCDLIFSICSAGKSFQAEKFKTTKSLMQALKKRPSMEVQYAASQIKKSKELQYSLELKSFMAMDASDEALQALYRTRILGKILPDFKRIEGIVQHDQYHRYTVDAHILQAIKKIREFYHKPKTLGKLRPLVREFTKQDWQILLWSALYHDIGKGRKTDHSLEGRNIVERDFEKFKFANHFTQEVMWVVENHLLLSMAAFRQDPHSPEVWQELFDKGAHGARLRRLALFTAADIQATNPDAWTSWKEKLLMGLVQAIEAPQGGRFLEFKQQLAKNKLSMEFTHKIDSGLLNSVPPKHLARDLKKLSILREATLEFFSHDRSRWVRFYDPVDREGLFLEYVSRLWQAGVVIDHAYVQTIAGFGVYDWFQIRSQKADAFLKKNMQAEPSLSKEFSVQFLDVALVSETQDEWIISFRGLDKKGVLLVAAQALHSLGLQIRWAKIHTWGRQIEDIFAITPNKQRSAGEWVDDLKKRLIKNQGK